MIDELDNIVHLDEAVGRCEALACDWREELRFDAIHVCAKAKLVDCTLKLLLGELAGLLAAVPLQNGRQ
eukprot:2304233-Prymnesium_polylepis.1